MLSRKECEKALEYLEKLEHEKDQCDEKSTVLNQLIFEHFDNPPLKFEELEIEKPYFDTNYNEWCIVQNKNPFITVYCDETISKDEFKENRFYRKQVEE